MKKEHSKTLHGYEFFSEVVMIFFLFAHSGYTFFLSSGLIFLHCNPCSFLLNHVCLPASILLPSAQKPGERKIKDKNFDMFRQMAFEVNTCGCFWGNGHRLLTRNIVLTGTFSTDFSFIIKEQNCTLL